MSSEDGSQAYLANIPFGFTTTPEQRLGPGSPYANPALQANLFFRVFLGFIAVMVSWIPARLLWRNGEFAATVFCVTVVLRNIGYIINALIWRDDNVAEWYAGYGWCDLQVYINFAMDTAFNTCLFEIMRSLYSKVGLDRATSLTSSERLRKQLISAAVIFTMPVVQVVLTFFLMVRRYNISTLVGCTTIYHFDWVFFCFYILPTPVFVTLAAILAVMVFRRFRKIEKLTREVIHSQDSVMAVRQQRVRRKLYFMTLGILVIVVPIIIALFVLNIVDGYTYWSDPYDYDLIHYGPDPFNTYFISFTTSDMVRFVEMNINYIPTLTAIVIFFVFGTTADALNDYRRLLLFCGLGTIFPKLREEYTPDGRSGSKRSWLSSMSKIFPSRGLMRLTSSSGTKKLQTGTVEHVSLTSQRGGSSSQIREDHNPWPDLSEGAIKPGSAPPKIPNRNPWLFRTTLPSFPLPSISLTSLNKGSAAAEPRLEEISHVSSAPSRISSLHRKDTTARGTAEKGNLTCADNQGDGSVWIGSSHEVARVDTRVWSTDGVQKGREVAEPSSRKTDWGFRPNRHREREQGKPDGVRGAVRVETEMRVASSDADASHSHAHANAESAAGMS